MSRPDRRLPGERLGALALEPYSKANTLLRVGQDAFNYSILGTDGFETLAKLIDESDCYTLTYSDMNEAIACLNELITREPVQGKDTANLMNEVAA